MASEHVVLVTGGTGGPGEAIARALHHAGHATQVTFVARGSAGFLGGRTLSMNGGRRMR